MLAPLALLLLAAPPPAAPSPSRASSAVPSPTGPRWPRSPTWPTGSAPGSVGSDGAAEAVRWAVAQFQAAGVPVRTERVKVARWIRGEERGEVLRRTRPGRAAPGSHRPRRQRAHPRRRSRGRGGGGDQPRGAGHRPGGGPHRLLPPPDVELGGLRRGLRAPQLRTGEGRGARAPSRRWSARPATGSLRSPHTGAAVFRAGDRPIPAVALATEDGDAHSPLARRPDRSGCACSSAAAPSRTSSRRTWWRRSADGRSPARWCSSARTSTPGTWRWARRTTGPEWRWCWRPRGSSPGCVPGRGGPSASCSS